MVLPVRRSYSGTAVATTLNGSINNTATSFTVVDATGWPDGSAGPFIATLDRTQSGEEKVLCATRTATTISVATNGRGYDGTAATSHTAPGCTVEHTNSKTDLDEANAHTSSAGGHDVVTVVGLSETQTLTNKTFGDSPHISDLTNLQHDHSDAAHGSQVPQTSVIGLTAALATAVPVAATGSALAEGTATTKARSDHLHTGGIKVTTASGRPTDIPAPYSGQVAYETDTDSLVKFSSATSSWEYVTHDAVCAVRRNASYTLATATEATIVWDTEESDLLGMHDTTTGIFTAKKAGCYFAIAQVAASTGPGFLQWVHNGTTNLGRAGYGDLNVSVGGVGFAMKRLAVNDTLRCTLYHESGSTQTITIGSALVYRLCP